VGLSASHVPPLRACADRLNRGLDEELGRSCRRRRSAFRRRANRKDANPCFQRDKGGFSVPRPGAALTKGSRSFTVGKMLRAGPSSSRRAVFDLLLNCRCYVGWRCKGVGRPWPWGPIADRIGCPGLRPAPWQVGALRRACAGNGGTGPDQRQMRCAARRRLDCAGSAAACPIRCERDS
jgi:hypothetical protein